ncbi:MAG: hypothetical protein PVF51_00690 [Nitrospirota bacterium]
MILDPVDFDLRLDPGVKNPEAIRPLRRPYRNEALASYPVRWLLDRPQNDGPEWVAALAGRARQADEPLLAESQGGQATDSEVPYPCTSLES